MGTIKDDCRNTPWGRETQITGQHNRAMSHLTTSPRHSRPAMFVGTLAAAEEARLALLTPAPQGVVFALETDGVVAGTLRDQLFELGAGHLPQLKRTQQVGGGTTSNHVVVIYSNCQASDGPS